MVIGVIVIQVRVATRTVVIQIEGTRGQVVAVTGIQTVVATAGRKVARKGVGTERARRNETLARTGLVVGVMGAIKKVTPCRSVSELSATSVEIEATQCRPVPMSSAMSAVPGATCLRHVRR